MRVFVTGASGHIGLPVVRDLLAAGHQVVGLARSEASAEKIASSGPRCRRALSTISTGCAKRPRNADGVIHLAFKHDLALLGGDFAGALAADLRAVEAIGEALAGSGQAVREHHRHDVARAQRSRSRRHRGRRRARRRKPARRFGEPLARVRQARRAHLDHAPGADGAQLARSPRLHPDARRGGAQERLLRLRRRRFGALARRAHARRRAPLSPRARSGARRARASTPRPRRAFPSARSRRRSVVGSTCRRRAFTAEQAAERPRRLSRS